LASERIILSEDGPSAPAPSIAQRISVTAKDAVYDFECAPGERILYAGLRQGLGLPYECASGTCGTCKATLAEGRTAYAWEEAPGRKYTRPERGEILMCQSLALSDVALSLSRPLDAPPRRRPDYFSGTIVRARKLVEDVLEFDVELERPLSFDAGQFVLLQADAVRGARSYSMVNFESPSSELRFLVKRLPGGAMTGWLFSHRLEGAAVRGYGPLGRATFDPAEAAHIVCIAGGSGIAGMMSMLSRGARQEHFRRYDARVFFGVRTPRDAFYLEELKSHARRFPQRVRVVVGFSDEDPTDQVRAAHPELEFERGFIHEVARRGLGAAPADTMVYIAGPPPMVEATLRMLLLDLKHSPRLIRYDKFS
jgi:toluene monooxygenase electron transfer component